MKRHAVLLILLSFCACSALNPRVRDFYQRGYRAGMQGALKDFKDKMDKSEPVHAWQPPVVEKVWIPGRLLGSVFVPGHEEWVMVMPGQWQLRLGPISTRGKLPVGRPTP